MYLKRNQFNSDQTPPKPKKVEPKPRADEKVTMKKKRIEYLDNYQYKKIKEFRRERNSTFYFVKLCVIL